MAVTFESLLAGRKLHELTDEEIDDLIKKLEPEELEKAQAHLRKSGGRHKKAKTSKAAQDASC